MAPHIVPRQDNPVAGKKYVAGGLVAGFVCFITLLCLLFLLRFRRSKAKKKRNAERRTASFRVAHAVPMMAESNPVSASAPPPFSRRGLTASIVMPEKTITRKPSAQNLSDKPVVSSRLRPPPASPTLSHLRPPSNAFSRPPRPRTTSILNPASPRRSRTSSGFSAYAQHSLSSRSSSRPSSTISASLTQARPVHQLFEAALPDELALVRYGECLTVLQSFDDGWCLVARDTSRSSRVSRVSVRMANNGDNVDIGLVPAWVFVKPLKGITVTRPFRNASVNALHLDQSPAPSYARDDIISWSNFA